MKQKPTKKCENGVQLRPASIEEAGLFYSELDEKQDEALGTVGHIRMDFGSGGKEFWHTWWPHNEKLWICGRNRPLPLLSPLYPNSG